MKKLPSIHTCTICKKDFYWDEESRWYGSFIDKTGNAKVLEKTCSNECLLKSKYVDEK